MITSSVNASTPVLIVGAGPSGLVLALWLRKRGIPFRIIDKASKPGTTSRALAVQARTLEFYRQLGIAEELIAAGVTVPEILLRRESRVVARGKVGDLGRDVSPFPYLLFCAQDVHETLLCDILKKMGVEVERDTELMSLTQDDQKVTAVLRGPRGSETVTATYLCGCDGAHSQVRHDLGTAFQGGTYSQVFFVADVDATGDAASGLQICVNRDGFCIVMPIRSRGSVRLTGIVPQAAEGKPEITYEDVRASVAKTTGLKVSNVRWFSSYHVHHRVAEHFQRGRVFLVGDAGHIHSPAGGQGMNTGIGDAVNLAWKLADVLQNRGEEKLLMTYEPERMAFARTLVRTTDLAFRAFTSRNVASLMFRDFLAPVLFGILTRFGFFLRFMFRTLSQTRIHYRPSLLSRGEDGNVTGGDRLPWIKFDGRDNFTSLSSLRWQVHIYGELNKEFGAAVHGWGLELHVFPWNREAGLKHMCRDGAYLVRPDGYIGLAIKHQVPAALQTYLLRIGYKNARRPAGADVTSPLPPLSK